MTAAPRKLKKKSSKKSSGKHKSQLKAVPKQDKREASAEGPSREELWKLLEEHLAGAIILDAKSNLLYANQAALKILGKELDQVLGVRVGKLKSFSQLTDQLSWQGEPCQLMFESTAERRLSKLKAEFKKSSDELEALQAERGSLEQRALDAEGRAQEMEGFLEQMESQQSELESRLEELSGKEREVRAEWESAESRLLREIADLKTSLESESAKVEEEKKLKAEVERILEKARGDCEKLARELSEVRESSLAEDSELVQKIKELQCIIGQTDEKHAEALRKITELESALQESRDETTIAKYDLNETQEKLKVTREKLENAEGRVKDAADELFKAWEVAEAAQNKMKDSDALKEKAEKRTAELEELMQKFTPEDDDTIMGFL